MSQRGRVGAVPVLALILGFAFLYGPILSIVIYSFNASRLVTVWGGFSTHWYGALWRDEAVLSAAWLSLRLAALSATLATILGALAGLVLTRFQRFVGRTLLAGLVTAPLVLPEIVTAIALLLLFVGLGDMIGWPTERGLTTLVIAHATFTLAFVAVVVQARLVDMDDSLELAAMDLGAPPVKAFLVITVPMLSPALVSGWLLAFSLSLDDVVTSQFVSGPGSTTLPLWVFASVRLGLNPEVNAIGTLVIAVVGAGTTASALVLAWRERRALARRSSRD